MDAHLAEAGTRPTHTEIVLQTGKGHLFAMEPDDAWVRPTVTWISGR